MSEVSPSPAPSRSTTFGVFAAALSILVLEIALTRMLSVVMWYHFAFVVVSMAMLGLAVSGLALYLVPPFLRAAPALIPWACRLAACSTVYALGWLAFVPFRTGPSAGMFDRAVALTYVVVLAPFLFSGFAISASLSHYAARIGKLYLFDLVGAGLGCVLVVLLLNLLGGPATIIAAAAGFFAAALLFHAGRGRAPAIVILDVLPLLACLGLVGWEVTHGTFEPRFQKGISDEEAHAKAVYSGWNSHSRIVVYERGDPNTREISIDGNATTGVRHLEARATPESVKRETPDLRHFSSTPYWVLPPKAETLIIGPGGGREMICGLHYDAEITGVELNGRIFNLMREGALADWSGHLYEAPHVTAIHDEARNWLRRSGRQFDLIQATLVDTWAATTSGAFSLAENALYTADAFDDYFSHLSPNGLVHITRWHRTPPRESVRVVVLMTEVMRRHRVEHPEDHIAVLLERVETTGPPYASMLWSKRPFTQEDLGKIDACIADRMKMSPTIKINWAWRPGSPSDDDVARFLTAPDKGAFIANYAYDITPTTDDRPFFFHTTKFARLIGFTGTDYENEQAVVILASVTLTVFGIVVAAFVIPWLLTLRRVRRASGKGTGPALLYFCGLGAGFMLVEMPALQRFGLYLGHPTHALSTILATLLLATGLGSGLSSVMFKNRPALGARVGCALVVLLIGALVVVVPQLLADTLSRPLFERTMITVGLLAPLGIAMGLPFPLGVRALAFGRTALTPWAWGMNGATSVLASMLGVVIGIYAGFTVAALIGAGAYLFAALAAGKLSRIEAPPAADPIVVQRVAQASVPNPKLL